VGCRGGPILGTLASPWKPEKAGIVSRVHPVPARRHPQPPSLPSSLAPATSLRPPPPRQGHPSLRPRLGNQPPATCSGSSQGRWLAARCSSRWPQRPLLHAGPPACLRARASAHYPAPIDSACSICMYTPSVMSGISQYQPLRQRGRRAAGCQRVGGGRRLAVQARSKMTAPRSAHEQKALRRLPRAGLAPGAGAGCKPAGPGALPPAAGKPGTYMKLKKRQ
jgi:hypothetical protein